MIKVLGINGSPRRNGNSAYLLNVALEGAVQASPDEVNIERYSFAGKKMSPCVSCFKCGELEGECAIKDHFQELRDKFLEADVVIYSVPVYHMSVPGQLKCYFDRLGNSMFNYYNQSSPRAMKVIGSIAQGCHFSSGQEHTITDLINHAFLVGGLPTNGDLWESYIGGVGWTYNDLGTKVLEKQYKEQEIDAQASVRSAFSVGRRAAEMAILLQEGALRRQEMLSKQETYKPFLNRILSHTTRNQD